MIPLPSATSAARGGALTVIAPPGARVDNRDDGVIVTVGSGSSYLTNEVGPAVAPAAPSPRNRHERRRRAALSRRR